VLIFTEAQGGVGALPKLVAGVQAGAQALPVAAKNM
jgi:hypothetical protein